VRKPAIGDCIRDYLASHGVTESVAEPWFRRIGLNGCYCGSVRRWINRRRLLHKMANCLGYEVEYDNGEIW
jgi:hypothetical protein